jgi:hypothetical protein
MKHAVLQNGMNEVLKISFKHQSHLTKVKKLFFSSFFGYLQTDNFFSIDVNLSMHYSIFFNHFSLIFMHIYILRKYRLELRPQ